MLFIKLCPQGKKQQADAYYNRIQLRIQTLNRQLERTLNGSCLQEKFRDRLELETIICLNFIILNTFVNIFLY